VGGEGKGGEAQKLEKEDHPNLGEKGEKFHQPAKETYRSRRKGY